MDGGFRGLDRLDRPAAVARLLGVAAFSHFLQSQFAWSDLAQGILLWLPMLMAMMAAARHRTTISTSLMPVLAMAVIMTAPLRS